MSKFKLEVRNGNGHLKLTLLGRFANMFLEDAIQNGVVEEESVQFKGEDCKATIYRTKIQISSGKNNVFEFDLLENSYLRIIKS